MKQAQHGKRRHCALLLLIVMRIILRLDSPMHHQRARQSLAALGEKRASSGGPCWFRYYSVGTRIPHSTGCVPLKLEQELSGRKFDFNKLELR